jgi:hypothetical protein
VTNLSETDWEEKHKEVPERLQKAEQVTAESQSDTAEEEYRKHAHARVWELARKQGVKPIRNMAELQGDFWPEEESIEEFLSWLRDLRQNDKPRSIPE